MYNPPGFLNPKPQQQYQPKPQSSQKTQGKTMEDLVNTLVNKTVEFM